MTERSLEQEFVQYRETGAVQSLARVFDDCAPELILIAGHLAPGAVDPEDLLQATFVDAIQHADRYDAERPLKPWLIGILIHCAQRERKRSRRQIDVDRLETRESIGPDTLAEAQEFGERFDEALQGLPTGYRQVLTLRLVHGLANTEIAHALCCPPSTVTTRMQRGLEMLRQALPASFTLATLVALLSERGLAMVRREVLQHAQLHPIVPAGGSTATSAMPLSASTKVLAAILLATIATTSWLVFDSDGAAEVTPPSSNETASDRELDKAQQDTTSSSANAITDDERIELPSLAITKQLNASGLQTTQEEPVALSLITGHVHDAHGRPVAAAAIITELDGSPDRSQLAKTSQNGSFAFRLKPSRIFWAELPGYQPSKFRFVPAGPGEHHIDLKLRHEGFRVQGRVRLPDGSPATSASVHFAIDGRTPSVNRDGVWIMPQPSLQATCDAQGEFHLDTVPPGTHPVIARVDGFGAAITTVEVLAHNPQRIELQLQVGAQLRGQIVDSRNTAIAGVRVRVSQSRTNRLGFDHAIAEVLTRTTLTDTNGQFLLSGITPGQLVVTANHPQYLKSSAKLEFAAGQTQHWNHALAPSQALHGILRDAEGRPLSEWLVAAIPSGSTNKKQGTRTNSNASGGFRLNGLRKSDHEIIVAPKPAGDLALPWMTVHKQLPGARAIDIQLPYSLEDAAEIRGLVLDDTGRPAQGAEVRIRGIDWLGGAIVLSQADGSFRIGPLMPGGYEISYAHAKYGKTSLGTHYVKTVESLDLGALQFSPKGQVQVDLAPNFDGPLGTIEMYFTQIDGPNGSGVYNYSRDRETKLPAGTYRIHLSGSHILATAETVHIEANTSETLVIPVSRATSVPLVFTAPEQITRRWQDSLRISILDARDTRIYSRVHQVDCVNGFEWTRGLDAGDYRIEARSFRGFESTQTISISPSDEAERIVIQLK